MKHVIQYKDKHSINGWQDDIRFGQPCEFRNCVDAEAEKRTRSKFDRTNDFRVIVEDDDENNVLYPNT